MPEPSYHLGAGSGSHGRQTGAMMIGMERVLREAQPDLVLVYGDTNSTLAAALVAAKTGVRLAHVEAGMRSFRRAMPEEVNRVVADRLSDLLFCSTKSAVEELCREGRKDNVHLVGDVMYDSFLFSLALCDAKACLRQLGLARHGYVLATVHRAENTDSGGRLGAIFDGLGQVANQIPVFLPLHPRTAAALRQEGLSVPKGVIVVDPLSYRSMVSLVSHASVVATDSGGLQKESYFAGVPCVTLRDETEWVETLENGWNRLARLTPDAIKGAVLEALALPRNRMPPRIYGDGDAAGRILTILRGLT